MGTKPAIISCCFTSEQLAILEQNCSSYYLQVLTECGSKLDLEQLIVKQNGTQLDSVFLNMIARKRAVTLHRIECKSFVFLV